MVLYRENISNIEMKFGIIKIINFFGFLILGISFGVDATPGVRSFSSAVDLLTNLMDPSQFYFDKRSNEAKPIDEDVTGMTDLLTILGQSRS